MGGGLWGVVIGYWLLVVGYWLLVAGAFMNTRRIYRFRVNWRQSRDSEFANHAIAGADQVVGSPTGLADAEHAGPTKPPC